MLAANGEPLSILGESECQVQLAGAEFVNSVLVTEDVSQDSLLGADFLALHGFILNLKSHTLCQGYSSTPLLLPQSKSLSICRVAVADNLILRGGEERLLWASVNCPPHTRVAGVIEPKEGFEECHQLLTLVWPES